MQRHERKQWVLLWKGLFPNTQMRGKVQRKGRLFV